MKKNDNLISGVYRIAVLLPCFNEEATVANVVKDFKRYIPEALIYVYDNNSSDIDEEFIGDCIPIVKETMSFVDIIFYIPYDSTVKIEDNGLRETDEKFITSVDNILKQVEEQ